jgi:hypothetical protein
LITPPRQLVILKATFQLNNYNTVKSNRLVNLFYNLLVCLFIVAILAPDFGPAAYFFGLFLFLCGLMPRYTPNGSFRNEVIRTVFSKDLQEKLFPDNSFYKAGQKDEGVDIDAKTVEVPQDEDGEAQYVINPTKFPLESYAEEDKKKTYDVDLLATKPELVTDLNQALVSYDKRGAKLRKHANTLNTLIANRIGYHWSPTKAEFIRQTTGSTNHVASAPGATGNRKRVTKEDMIYFQTMFNDLDIPLDGRRAVFPAHMYEDLLLIPDFVDADKLGKMGAVPSGVIGSIYGFMIYIRSKTTVYTEAATPVKKPIGAAGAATDNLSALFYHPAFVRYAEGNVKLYLNPDQGQYLGGTMNAAVRSGGMISRLSEVGVGALVEDNA